MNSKKKIRFQQWFNGVVGAIRRPAASKTLPKHETMGSCGLARFTW